MIACENCGFLDEQENFPKHPESVVSDIEVRSFGGLATLLIPILVCPNCKATEIPGKMLAVND